MCRQWKKISFFQVVFKTKGENRPCSCGESKQLKNGGERSSHFTVSSDPPEGGREWGGKWSTSRQGKGAEVRQELGGWGWSEHAVRELTGVGDPVTQHRAGRIQNQILQMPEAPSYGWSMGWLSVQPPAHAHGIVLMLGYTPPGNQSMLMDTGCLCEVTTKVLLLCCECLFASVY